MEEPDYSTLIDAETWAFIRETEAFCPADCTILPIHRQRAAYETLWRAFDAGRPDGVATDDREAAGVPVRCYQRGHRASEATVLYLHGGGFILGGLDSHDDVCAEICAATGFQVVSVDYRLAPEHPHPAAVEDCQLAYRWAAHRTGRPMVVVGDSAGGTLAAAVALRMRGTGQSPVGQVLIYPLLGNDRSQGSFIEHQHAPMLTRDDLLYYDRARAGEVTPLDDATFAPLNAETFRGLPPTVVFTAEFDPLRDDGAVYSGRLRAAGVPALWFDEAALVHGYLRARHRASRAKAAFARILRAIGMLGRDKMPDRDLLIQAGAGSRG